ncbi:mRNA turnover 4 [Gaertneriomyces sp. JEL0708]|nr:mRNA turnover 4 [Gaertneriomyces sp. JEL0708]
MPKSKRAKVVHLTKTEKKGREGKENAFNLVRECIDKYKHVYIFSVENMRNTYLKEVRNERKQDRFFYGRNKVIAKALGTTEEEEYKEGLRHVSERLVGNVGLVFSDSEPEEILPYFENYHQMDYARSGCVATETMVVPEGPVMRGEEKFPHNMEPQLRGLGMPTCLVNGVVTLRSEYTICKEGDMLTPDQAQLLKHFYIQQADFHVTIVGHWTNGEFKALQDNMDETKME